MRQVNGAAPRDLMPPHVLKDGHGPVGAGARYLGYGVMTAFASRDKGTQEGQLTRGCLLPPLSLIVELRCRDLAAPERARLLLALRAIGLMGAMGSKSRKGYGSLVLRELTGERETLWQAPRTPAELVARLVELRRGCAASGVTGSDEPPYTALTSRSRQVVVAAQRPVDALTLLDFVGREIVRYRSWGRSGKVLGSAPREERFRADHDLYKDAAQGNAPAHHPLRAVFGLPHNYGKRKEDEVTPEHGDRRASPLLVHIHRCERTPVAVLSFLPAKFLPENTKIVAFKTKVPVAVAPALWAPVDDLLDRFLGRASEGGTRKEPFGEALEVRP